MCFPGGSNGRDCLQCRRPGFNPWVRKIPWRRKWQPTPVSLPGESHRQRSLAGYSPWGCKESDTTEQLHFHFSLLMSPAYGWVALLRIVKLSVDHLSWRLFRYWMENWIRSAENLIIIFLYLQLDQGFLFQFLNIFFLLGYIGLSCGTWDLCSITRDLLLWCMDSLVARSLSSCSTRA